MEKVDLKDDGARSEAEASLGRYFAFMALTHNQNLWHSRPRL